LDCLSEIIDFNIENKIKFLRICSGLIPFASHEKCKFKWQKKYRPDFAEIGEKIKLNKIRISMHPDQFVLINAIKKKIVENSIRELLYHSQVMDLLELPHDCKIQIHVGGVYEDKDNSIKRFVKNYNTLPQEIKKRLVIENDERLYSLNDCLKIHSLTGIPILFDSFHHSLHNSKEPLKEAVLKASKTWLKKDGHLMLDYSSQSKDKRIGAHAETLDTRKFKKFILDTSPLDFDIMLEIKDKEKSALKALKILKKIKNSGRC